MTRGTTMTHRTDAEGARRTGAGDDGDGRTAERMLEALSGVYERGWQPQDVLHVTARHRPGVPRGLIVALLLAHAYRCTRLGLAPRAWAGQVQAMACAEPDADRAARRYARRGGRVPGVGDGPHGVGAGGAPPAQGAPRGFPPGDLILLWGSLPEWPHLCPPPSRWAPHTAGAHGTGASDGRHEAPGPRVLARIRGLLAKAESTDFPEEAEALTAKAQELITRHAVDSALLRGGFSGPGTAGSGTAGPGAGVAARRIHLDNPYLREKVTLLAQIGRVNTVRVVWSKRLAIATVVGTADALEQVELLFTSLLVQATRAMHTRSPRGTAPGRTAMFRRSFLMGFAAGIGQRLDEARSAATRAAAADAGVGAGALVPVFRAQEDAVRRATQRLFPRSRPTRAGKVDPRGWCAGTDAADRAVLTAGGPGLAGHRPLPHAGTP